MSRLPEPGQDDGTWGTILNDFLSVEHNADGSLKASGSLSTKVDSSTLTSSLATKADDTTVVHNTDKATANGVATLDGTTHIPAVQLPDLSATYATTGALTTEASTARTAEALAVPRWQSATMYALGAQVVSPNNDVVNANVTHTSAAAYVTDAAKWVGSATYLTMILPEKYGAVGDWNGTVGTDDTLAIQSALDAASSTHAIVHLTAKQYHVPGGLTIPAGVTLEGEGKTRSILVGFVRIGSDVTVRDLRIGKDGSNSVFVNGATNSIIERAHFKGGSSSANFYMNNASATNCRFTDCDFTDNISAGNGIQIVDKGTALYHFENITFTRCNFHDNGRMNFECIQRSDVGSPVISGYRGIDLIDCDFGPTSTINVSFDSGLLDDLTARSSGYCRVDGCRITGGTYGLELAGCIEMHITDNTIKDATSLLLSMSVIGTELSRCVIARNRFIGTRNVVISGARNLVESNYLKTNGSFRFSSATKNTVSRNFIDCLGTTGISVESSSNMWFVGNAVYGGSGQSVLNIYTGSTGNTYQGNYFDNSNVTIDVRDGVSVVENDNYCLQNSVRTVRNPFPYGTVLPTASAGYRGLLFRLAAANGTADTLHICLKNAADAYVWVQVSTA